MYGSRSSLMRWGGGAGHWRGKLALGAVSLIAVFLAAACASPPGQAGASGSSSGGGGGGSTVVREVVAGDSLSFANALYAQAAGLFEAQGLKMDYLPSPNNSSTTATELITGAADIAFVTNDPVYPAIAQSRGIKLYATTTTGVSHAIVLNNTVVKQLAAKGITPSSPLDKRIQALKGLNIAQEVAGTSAYTMFQTVLKDGGLSASDVHAFPVTTWTEAADAARQDRVDGYVAPAPDNATGPSQGWGTLWLKYDELPEFKTVPYIMLAANTSFAQAHPDVMTKVLKAMWETVSDFKTKPASVSSVLKSKFFANTNPKLFSLAFNLVDSEFTATLTPDQAGLTTQLGLYNSVAQVPVKLSFAQVYDLSFVNKTGPAASA